MAESTPLYALTATEALARLEAGELTSVALLEALDARADDVEPAVNALTHQFRLGAMAEAVACDAERAEGKLRGRLHGLPITVKECIDTEGVATTLGVVRRVSDVARRDAVAVQLAKEAGAIVWAKTNNPQTLMVPMETTNDVYGTTHNPWRKGHGPGGSSGGEGAALASGTSLLGIGTDIGGSIRTPAAFCGVTGIKPTAKRWPMRGSQTAIAGQEVVKGQMGPMARTVEDLDLFMQAMDPTRAAELDPDVPPVPYTPIADVDVRALRVGVYESDGFLIPAASVRRAVREAAAALEGQVASVSAFVPGRVQENLDVYFGALSADGQASVDRLLGSDRVVQPLSTLRRVAKLPDGVRKAAAKVLAQIGEHRVSALMNAVGPKSVDVLWGLTARRTELRRAEIEAWDEAGVDVLVCPAYATPAAPQGLTHDFTLGFACAARYNLLDFPAGAVPVTRVRPDEVKRHGAADRVEKRAAEIEAASEGLPVGVQVVARPYREHEALAVMAAIESIVRDGREFPTTPVDPR